MLRWGVFEMGVRFSMQSACHDRGVTPEDRDEELASLAPSEAEDWSWGPDGPGSGIRSSTLSLTLLSPSFSTLQTSQRRGSISQYVGAKNDLHFPRRAHRVAGKKQFDEAPLVRPTWEYLHSCTTGRPLSGAVWVTANTKETVPALICQSLYRL